MNKTQALELLQLAPIGRGQSVIDATISLTQAVYNVRRDVLTSQRDILTPELEKRVWQVVKNQVRPTYDKS